MSNSSGQEGAFSGISYETEGDPDQVTQLTELMMGYFQHHPRGQQLAAHLRGEGPEPEPLYLVGQDVDGGVYSYLGLGDVEITELDPALHDKLKDLIEGEDLGD